MNWHKFFVLNAATPPLASLVLFLTFAQFDDIPLSVEALTADLEFFAVVVAMHLLGTLLIATPATLWVLRRKPSHLVFTVKLVVAGLIGGAFLAPFSPVFGALAGLNAALIWCGIATLLLRVVSNKRIANA